MVKVEFQLGKVRIKRIEESLGPGAPPNILFPEFDEKAFELHKEWMTPNFLDEDSGCLMISSASWYVETPTSKIIIDTCVGNCKDRPGYPPFGNLETPYLENLEAAGIKREEIDYVLITHLHIDHVGWNTTLEDGKWVPTFPKAKYVFSAIDLEAWDPANGPLPLDENQNVFEDSIQPVVEAGLVLTWKEQCRIDDAVSAYLTPGHTPGHCAINVSSGGKTVIFCGDVVHSPIQVVFPEWNTIFCDDKEQAAKMRREVLKDCADHGHLLAPAHWGVPHAAYITHDRASGGFAPQFLGAKKPFKAPGGPVSKLMGGIMSGFRK